MTEKSSYELMITAEESLVLEAIAQSVIPYSQRAQALLAVDAGSTVVQAAGVAGLKDTQVRYWMGRFRKTRLQIFPQELLTDIEALIEEQRNLEKAEKKTSKKSAKKSKKKSDKKTGKKADAGTSKKKSKKSKKKKVDKIKGPEKKKDSKTKKPKSKRKKSKKSGKKK